MMETRRRLWSDISMRTPTEDGEERPVAVPVVVAVVVGATGGISRPTSR